MVLWTPPGEIPKYKARSKPWALTDLAQIKANKQKIIYYGQFILSSVFPLHLLFYFSAHIPIPDMMFFRARIFEVWGNIWCIFRMGKISWLCCLWWPRGGFSPGTESWTSDFYKSVALIIECATCYYSVSRVKETGTLRFEDLTLFHSFFHCVWSIFYSQILRMIFFQVYIHHT